MTLFYLLPLGYTIATFKMYPFKFKQTPLKTTLAPRHLDIVNQQEKTSLDMMRTLKVSHLILLIHNRLSH